MPKRASPGASSQPQWHQDRRLLLALGKGCVLVEGRALPLRTLVGMAKGVNQHTERKKENLD